MCSISAQIGPFGRFVPGGAALAPPHRRIGAARGQQSGVRLSSVTSRKSWSSMLIAPASTS
jgi:hypothetical protein